MPRGRPKKKIKLPPHVYVVGSTGSWFVRRSFPTHQRYPSGRPVYEQISRRCDPHTPERAQEVYDELGRMQDEIVESVTGDTVETFFEMFLSTKKGKVGVRTHEGYTSIYRTYIKGSRFGQTPLELATPLAVQQFYDTLQESGTSAKMIRKLHGLMSMAFTRGVMWDKLNKNPCVRGAIMLPRADEPEIEFWHRDEARKFFKVAYAEKYLVLAFGLETGMRPGEFLGVRWRDLNLVKQQVTVNQAVSFLRNGDFLIKPPKTRKSKRTLDISPQLCEALAKHREWLNEELSAAKKREAEPLKLTHINARKGARYDERKLRRKLAREYQENVRKFDLVFPSETGMPRSATNLGRREMVEVCKAAGIRKISLYGLRHTNATLMLDAGVNIKAVSERLGHASVEITLKTYAHVLPSMRLEAANAMTNALY